MCEKIEVIFGGFDGVSGDDNWWGEEWMMSSMGRRMMVETFWRIKVMEWLAGWIWMMCEWGGEVYVGEMVRNWVRNILRKKEKR